MLWVRARSKEVWGPYENGRWDNVCTFARIGSQFGKHTREVWWGRRQPEQLRRVYKDGKRTFPAFHGMSTSAVETFRAAERSWFTGSPDFTRTPSASPQRRSAPPSVERRHVLAALTPGLSPECEAIHGQDGAIRKSVEEFRKLLTKVKLQRFDDNDPTVLLYGNCPLCHTTVAIELPASDFSGLGDTWAQYVKGEWWIEPDGTVTFADGDVGEQGHEGIALDRLIDLDSLLDKLVEDGRWDKQRADEYANHEGSSCELYHQGNITPDIGRAIVGDEMWQLINLDPRLAFVRKGAIRVIGREFEVWRLTPKLIRSIQHFIEERVFDEGGDVPAMDAKTDMCITEIADENDKLRKNHNSRYGCLPIAEFLTIKHPKQILG